MPAASTSRIASRRRVLAGLECAGRAQRVHAGAKQRLVGVDVADAGDPALVEQERLDRGAPPARQRAQQRGREGVVERLDAEARGEERLERLVADHQLAGAESGAGRRSSGGGPRRV